MLLYVHRDNEDYQGLGAQDSHLDFHTAPELCQPRAVSITDTTCALTASVILSKPRGCAASAPSPGLTVLKLSSFRVDEIHVPFGSSGVEEVGVFGVVAQTHDAVASVAVGSQLSD